MDEEQKPALSELDDFILNHDSRFCCTIKVWDEIAQFLGISSFLCSSCHDCGTCKAKHILFW
jgi:hypothetical protein